MKRLLGRTHPFVREYTDMEWIISCLKISPLLVMDFSAFPKLQEWYLKAPRTKGGRIDVLTWGTEGPVIFGKLLDMFSLYANHCDGRIMALLSAFADPGFKDITRSCVCARWFRSKFLDMPELLEDVLDANECMYDSDADCFAPELNANNHIEGVSQNWKDYMNIMLVGYPVTETQKIAFDTRDGRIEECRLWMLAGGYNLPALALPAVDSEGFNMAARSLSARTRVHLQTLFGGVDNIDWNSLLRVPVEPSPSSGTTDWAASPAS